MQTHGEEQLKLYTEAFVEFDFRPFKRYKRFTHSLFLLVANFILAIMVDPLKEHPEIMTFSMIMGAIASVLLIVLCNNHESSYINRFYHDGLIILFDPRWDPTKIYGIVSYEDDLMERDS